jgi:hypothetical protein
MKRALSLSFLFLAGIVILVHAVIPHHHHDGVPVIPISAHHDDSHPDDPNNTEIVYVRLNNDKQICQSLDFNYDLLPCLSTLFSDNSTYQIKNDTGLPFRHQPYLLLHYTQFIACSIGLRAPPL